MSKKFIDEIHLVNWKKHSDLTAKINGNHFMAIGPNGAGKSSVFQAILRLLGRFEKLPEEVSTLKEGSTDVRANISSVLVNNGDKYIVEEKFNKDGKGRVRFRKLNANGGSDDLTPAIERIKEIFGDVVDLTPLMALTGIKQFEFLQKALNLDLSAYKVQRKYKFEDRQLVNREIKTLEAKLNSPEFHNITPDDLEQYKEEKDVHQILKKKEDTLPLRQQIQDFHNDKRTVEVYNVQIKSIDEQIKKLQSQKAAIVKQKDALDVSDERFIKMNCDLATAEESNKKVDQELAQVTTHNNKFRLYASYKNDQKELEQKRAKANAITEEIKDLDKNLRESLTKLNLDAVYEGLELKYTFDEKNEPEHVGLYLNKLPFNKLQLSYGEMIKALIKLSCFLNPNGLNFIWIEDWSLLDKKNQNDLLDFAKENENVQFGIEKVDDTKEIVLDFISHDSTTNPKKDAKSLKASVAS